MKRFLSVLLLVCPLVNFSQVRQPVRVGDVVPELEFAVFNYTKPQLRLSELKGKLLILDFWASYCRTCIEALPKVQALQDAFEGKVQIVFVNTFERDTDKTIKDLMGKQDIVSEGKLTIPYTSYAKDIQQLFPHKYVPQYVLIDTAGRLIAVTNAEEINKERIADLLSGKRVTLHQKKDDLNFDRNKPLFANGNGGSEVPFIYRSLFTGYREGLGGGIVTDRDSGGLIRSFRVINTHLWTLYSAAYPGWFNKGYNLIAMTDEIKKQLAGMADSKEFATLYCYQIELPGCTEDELRRFIQEDLYRLMRLEVDSVSIVKRRLALKGKRPVDRRPLRGRAVDTKTMLAIINDLPCMQDLYVTDETGLPAEAVCYLPEKLTGEDEEGILQLLTQMGFEWTKEERLQGITRVQSSATGSKK